MRIATIARSHSYVIDQCPCFAVLWVLRVLLAAVFLSTGVRKWLGDDAMTATFAELGAGQWLRYVTGTLEIAGAIGLLIPFFAGPPPSA